MACDMSKNEANIITLKPPIENGCRYLTGADQQKLPIELKGRGCRGFGFDGDGAIFCSVGMAVGGVAIMNALHFRIVQFVTVYHAL